MASFGSPLRFAVLVACLTADNGNGDGAAG
jgi:hypothetical protein